MNDIDIEGLRQRLTAAEQVCVLFGWTGSSMRTDNDKAVLQAWMDWHHAYPDATPAPQDPEWAARIAELARRRDEIRSTTLERRIRSGQ